MGVIAQDNAYAERVNGTMKNEYLKLWYIKDYSDLKRKLRKAVNHYNQKRVHLAFKNKLTPISFKKSLLNLDIEKRPKVIVYSLGNYNVLADRSFGNLSYNTELVAHNCPIGIMNNKVNY